MGNSMPTDHCEDPSSSNFPSNQKPLSMHERRARAIRSLMGDPEMFGSNHVQAAEVLELLASLDIDTLERYAETKTMWIADERDMGRRAIALTRLKSSTLAIKALYEEKGIPLKPEGFVRRLRDYACADTETLEAFAQFDADIMGSVLRELSKRPPMEIKKQP